MRTTILRSNDFTCPSCVTRIETNLGKLDGVDSSTVHFGTGRIVVSHDPDRISAGRLIEEVRRLGYESRESPF